MKVKTSPRGAHKFSCYYDSDLHSVLCTVAADGHLFELFDGCIVASTATLKKNGAPRYIKRNKGGSLVVYELLSYWIPSGLERFHVLDTVAVVGSPDLREDLVAICDHKLARVIDVLKNLTVWATEGSFDVVALSSHGHVALANNRNLTVFASVTTPAPRISTRGVATSLSSNCSSIEWIPLQHDYVVAVFQLESTVIDLYNLVNEPGDGMGKSEDPILQVLHLSTLRLPSASFPRIVSQSPGLGSPATRLTLMHWENKDSLRWCTYRFSQHSVPQQDVGGRVQVDIIGKSREAINAVEIMPCFIDRQAVVTPAGTWERSHPPSVLMYVGFDDGALLSVTVDHGACFARLDKVILGGVSLRPTIAFAAVCDRFVARLDVTDNVVKSELLVCTHTNTKHIAVQLVQSTTCACDSKIEKCELTKMPFGFSVFINGSRELQKFNITPSSESSEQITRTTVTNAPLIVRLSPIFAVSYNDSVLPIPAKCHNIDATATIAASHASRGFVMVAIRLGEVLFSIVWDLVTARPPILREYNGVVAAASTSKNDIVIVSHNGDVCLHRWFEESLDYFATIDITGDCLEAFSLTKDSVACMTSRSIFVFEMSPSNDSILLSQIRGAAFSLDWRRLKLFLATLSTDDSGAQLSALLLVQERTGQSIWSQSHSRHGRLAVVSTPDDSSSWRPGQHRYETIDSALLDCVASRLIDVQLHGLSSTDQLELLTIIESIKASRAALEQMRDPAASRAIFALHGREVQRQLRLPLVPLTWLAALWAAVSNSQDVVINQATLAFERKGSNWDEVASSKISFWAKSLLALRKVAECVARQQYQVNREVRDCALMYLLSGKKSTLIALCKAGNDLRLHQFFSRDFLEEKNRNAAVSNAYAALGKGNIVLAAAFFVLAGDPKNAAQIVLDRTGDTQLAMIIIRLSTEDDKTTIQWLFERTQDKFQATSSFESSLFHIRMDNHVEAMCTVASCHSTNAFELFESMELLHFASSQVMVLSRRVSEFFDQSTEVVLLSALLRACLADKCFAFRANSVKALVQDALRRENQAASAAKAPSQMLSSGASRHTVGAADFASGTVQFCMDSDDDDEPVPTLPAPDSAPPQSVGKSLLPNQIAAVESLIGESEAPSRTTTPDEEADVLSWLISSPAAVERGVCTAQLDDQSFTEAITKLVSWETDPAFSKDVVCPALLLLLTRRFVRSEDTALAIATLSCSTLWSNDAPCACEHRLLVSELWACKSQALDRSIQLFDAVAVPNEKGGLNDNELATCLFQLATVNVCFMLLKRLSTALRRPASENPTPLRSWALNTIAYHATALVRNAETALIVNASRIPRDETLSFTSQCREAKHFLELQHTSALLSSSLLNHASEQGKFLKYLATFTSCFCSGRRIPELIIPPGGVPIEKYQWFKQLLARCKATASTDELFAMATQDESALRWFQYVWSLRNHRVADARRFLVNESLATGAALQAPQFFHTENHAITTLVVDNSTCDNIAVGTSSKVTLVHGLREMLAGDNGVYLEQRAAERNASLESFASWMNAKPSSPTSRASLRNSLGASAQARLAAHPHLPFFVASQQDGHLDVFNFGDMQCAATFSLEHHTNSGPSSLLDTWLPPVFSPNGYFISFGQRATGEILSLQFEDVITGSQHSAASLAKKAHSFSGTCTSVIHIAPYSAVVLAAGTDIVPPASSKSTSRKNPTVNVVRMVDPLVSKSTLLSCEVPHETDYLVFDGAKRQALCISSSGMMSLYDTRKNSIVSTVGLLGGGLKPQTSRIATQKTSSISNPFITSVEPLTSDDLLAVGLSNSTLLLLPHCVPDLGQLCTGDSNDEISATASVLIAPSHGTRPIPITAMSATPSALLCGLGDGRVCSISIIPDTIKKQIQGE